MVDQQASLAERSVPSAGLAALEKEVFAFVSGLEYQVMPVAVHGFEGVVPDFKGVADAGPEQLVVYRVEIRGAHSIRVLAAGVHQRGLPEPSVS